MPGDHTAREAQPRPQTPASPSVGSPVPGVVSDACTACHLAPRWGRHFLFPCSCSSTRVELGQEDRGRDWAASGRLQGPRLEPNSRPLGDCPLSHLQVRCAAVFALGTFVGNSAERTDHSTTIDHNVAMMLAQLINDGSPVVRKVRGPRPQAAPSASRPGFPGAQVEP